MHLFLCLSAIIKNIPRRNRLMSTFKIQISAIPDTSKHKDGMITNFKSKGLSTTTLNYFDLNGSFSLINGLLQKLNRWWKAHLNLDDVYYIQQHLFYFFSYGWHYLLLLLAQNTDFATIQPFEFRLKWNAFAWFSDISL